MEKLTANEMLNVMNKQWAGTQDIMKNRLCWKKSSIKNKERNKKLIRVRWILLTK